MKIFASMALTMFPLLASCCTVAPAEDYPILPMPEQAVEEVVNGVKQVNGIFFPTEEVKKIASNLENLRAERNALRKVIEKYNEWAREKSGEPE